MPKGTPNPASQLEAARNRFATKARSALMQATPLEALQAWMFIKGQQLLRTTPGLSEEQKQSILAAQAKELGSNIILEAAALSGETKSLVKENVALGDDEELAEPEESDTKDLTASVEPALKRVQNTRFANRNGKRRTSIEDY